MLRDVSLKSKLILFVAAMCLGAVGFIVSWSVWTLIIDHQRLNEVWNLELRRAAAAQGK